MATESPSSPAYSRRSVGVSTGLASAALFGLSTPLSKLLLDDFSPLLLAALLYAGAAIALWIALLLRPRVVDAALRRADLPKLAGVVLLGGVAAPIALLTGLSHVSAATSSLLTNLEGPFTLLLALLVFGEHLSRRALVGALAIFAGAALLTFGGSSGTNQLTGIALIVAACLFWAIDNNLTQALTVRDPLQLVVIKASVAAVINFGLALALEGWNAIPLTALLAALLLGAGSYGISILLDTVALRHLGAAREAALFALAPFIGFVVSLLLFGLSLTAAAVAALVAMAIGTVLLLTERHDHEHTHEPFAHDHVHAHDEHHRHVHTGAEPPLDPRRGTHSHEHRHAELTHQHPHTSDVHHRH